MLHDVKRRRIILPDRAAEIALIDFGGDGPPLLAHHANGFCAALWAPVAERLRDRFHFVAMDARGHGDSGKPEDPAAYAWNEFVADAGAVADHLAEESGRHVALGLGHSFGGTSILGAAAERPGRFANVVCVDPVIMPSVVPPERLESSNELVEKTQRRRRHWPDRDTALEHLRSRSLFAGWTQRALELYVDEGMTRRADGSVELKCPPEIEAFVFGGPRGLDIFTRVAGMTTPARLLWARRGNFPRALYEALVSGMDAGSIEDVDAGHLVTMEAPDLVVDAVLRFLDEDQRSTG